MPNLDVGRRITVLQPSYLPWLGVFDQMARADVFIYYDDVQYDKNGWRNRNRIRTDGKLGWAWLTVPVLMEETFPNLLKVRTDPRVPWQRKHRKALEMAYSRAPFKSLLGPVFDELFETPAKSSLVEIAIASTQALALAFGIKTPTFRSSALNVAGDRNTRLLGICRHFGASAYLSGVAAKSYLDVDLFLHHGIAVEWQDFVHPQYVQPRQPFISHLSAVDALLCVGPSAGGAFLGYGLSHTS